MRVNIMRADACRTEEARGTLFDIRRFAVHDGPGIRTTLFLKGCPLRCRWCHNPEGLGNSPVLAYYPQKCLHCGECVPACPVGAHTIINGRHVFNRDACTACGLCVAACPGRALKCYGREISVGEARNIVLEDQSYYRNDGGVTLSGGEPLLQADFCSALFKALQSDGIHCALDTSGAVAWEKLQQVLPYTDYVLYDVKHVDDAQHKIWIGTSNTGILSNLKQLSTQNVPIEVRVPLIPGLNLDEHSLLAIGHFLAGLENITAVRLLPYHPAQSKFDAVGMINLMSNAGPPHPEQLNMARDLMRALGLQVPV